MPDTGAPWNIPYVEAADLVSDWPADSLALANAIADGLDEAGNAGIGSNVVQAVKTDIFSSSSTTYTTITGLQASITPSSATSKILVIANIKGTSQENIGTSNFSYQLVRGATPIFIGDAGGSRVRASGSLSTRLTGTSQIIFADTAVFLDSPATASSVTYEVQGRTDTGGFFNVNRTESDVDVSALARVASSLTLVEVEA